MDPTKQKNIFVKILFIGNDHMIMSVCYFRFGRRSKMAGSPRVLVYGGRGALGSAIVKYFKGQNKVRSLDFTFGLKFGRSPSHRKHMQLVKFDSWIDRPVWQLLTAVKYLIFPCGLLI